MWNGLFNQLLLRKYSKEFKPIYRQKELVREYVQQIENGLFKGETRNYLKVYDLVLKGLLGYVTMDVCFDEKMDDGVGRSEFVLKSGDKRFMVVELKGQGVLTWIRSKLIEMILDHRWIRLLVSYTHRGCGMDSSSLIIMNLDYTIIMRRLNTYHLMQVIYR